MTGRSRILIAMVCCVLYGFASAFGVDVCFNDPTSGEPPIRNCIGVGEACRTSHLTLEEEFTCRLEAMSDSLKGLTGTNTIIGGRSLVHSDSTYFMAQMLGFSPWQAYQMMIYSEATDQSEYTAFDRQGRQMLTDEEMKACRANWGPSMPRHCLLITPEVKGVSKFNFHTGGMFLHLQARFSSDGKPPPKIFFPTDYFSEANVPYEMLLRNFRAWAFDERPDACAAGIMKPSDTNKTGPAACEQTTAVLHSPMNVFPFGFSKLAIPFITELGPLIIEEREAKQGVSDHVMANNESLQAYLAPHNAAYAKMGMFVHALGDRYSHHMCTDASYTYKTSDTAYLSDYASSFCAQGSHFLWHVWEQGTNQSDENLAIEHQTMRPALEAVYDQLWAYGRHQGWFMNPFLNKQAMIDDLIQVLQRFDPEERLDAMVALMERKRVLPLPGHGHVANDTVDEWLKAAGAPL